jgi:hypothetical protein
LLLEGDPPEGSISFAAEVLNAEPNFARHSQLVNLQAGNVIFGVSIPIDRPINSGWKVQVIIPEDKAYFFDEATEARIKAA